jgi:ABC-type bacteriocin/lantibiotic exporter with double-glycine peptidase domain
MRRHSVVVLSYAAIVFAQANSLPLAVGALPEIEDEQYKTACGVIACCVALRSLGVEAPLDELAEKCKWEKGSLIPLDAMAETVRTYRGIDCELAKLSPQELCEALEDDQTVVILATRRDSQAVDHAVCAVGVEDNGQTIRLIDYPDVRQQKTVAEIAEAWDGASLVVRVSPLYRAMDRFFGLFLVPIVACVVVVCWLFGPRRRKESRSTPQSDG